MMPPSPRLSARMISTTYLIETTIISDQKMVDRPPRMFSAVSGMPCAGENVSFTAYSGLVPMSPKTTPSASRVSAAWEECDAWAPRELIAGLLSITGRGSARTLLPHRTTCKRRTNNSAITK